MTPRTWSSSAWDGSAEFLPLLSTLTGTPGKRTRSVRVETAVRDGTPQVFHRLTAWPAIALPCIHPRLPFLIAEFADRQHPGQHVAGQGSFMAQDCADG